MPIERRITKYLGNKVKYTKNGQPYYINKKSGKARFISRYEMDKKRESAWRKYKM